MKDLTRAASIAQIIQCVSGDLSFGIDKANVLSIQRTDRLVLRSDPACPDVHTLSDELESTDEVVGFLSDGVRHIPIIRLSQPAAAGGPPLDGMRSSLDDAARIILFAALAAVGGSSSQITSPPWGLWVDRVVGTLDAPRKRFHAAPWMVHEASRPVFRTVVRIENEVLMLLDARSASPYRGARGAMDGAFPQLAPGVDQISKQVGAQSTGKLNGPTRDTPVARGLVITPLWEGPDGRRVSLGLSISQVPEILEAATVIASPLGPDYVTGIVFWREMPIPVIDIAARLGFQSPLGSASSPGRRFIIARQHYTSNGDSSHVRPAYAALEVCSAVRILRLPIESQPSRRSLPVHPGMVLGQVELEEETLVIPDLKAVLSLDGR